MPTNPERKYTIRCQELPDVENPDEEVKVVWVTSDDKRHQTAFTTRARANKIVVPGILTDYQGRIQKIWLEGRRCRVRGGVLYEIRDCICGLEFEVVKEHARPWTVCVDCMKAH